MGSFLVIICAYFIAKGCWWWYKQDGKAKTLAWMDRREDMKNCNATLPEDMQFLKAKVSQLAEFTGLPEDEEAAGEKEPLDQLDEEVAAEVDAGEEE